MRLETRPVVHATSKIKTCDTAGERLHPEILSICRVAKPAAFS
jgi:hypothetical protein